MNTKQIQAELQQSQGRFKRTLEYFDDDTQRALLFLDRYAVRDETGMPVELTYDDTIQRLANAVDSEQISLEQAGWLLKDFRFVPGGRILRGLGDDAELTIYNCLTLPRPKDTLSGEGGIMDIAAQLAEAQKKGAGVGFRIDSLRPENAPLKSSKGVSSGAVSFLHLYDVVTGVIKQGGSRRGATLIAMSATHPDVCKFIKVKQAGQALLSNMNISVICSDTFMQAVRDDKEIELDWNGGKAQAGKIFDVLVQNAHATGDPGIIFEDAMIRGFSTQHLGHPFELVNACSEIPLPAYGVCLLGSINLMACAEGELGEGNINIGQLDKITRMAVRFLDRVIDLGKYPLPQCEAVQQATRRLGIGVMGLAHALIWCGKRYDNQEGRGLAKRIFKCIKKAAWAESHALAEKYETFPASKNYYSLLLSEASDLRNSALLAAPPTGSTSDLAGVSAGIEPVFFDRMQRKDGLGEYELWDPLFKIWNDKHLIRPPHDRFPEFFQTAHQISPRARVEMQAVIQQQIDNAISSTVNLPHKATISDVKEIYLQAWGSGCKSITIYRDGSRQDAPIQAEPVSQSQISRQPASPPFVTDARRYKVPYQGDDKLFITISHNNGKPFEVFISTKRADHIAWVTALTITISKFLQGKLTLESLISELKAIKDPQGGTWFGFGEEKGRYVPSGPAALGLVLEHFLGNRTQMNAETTDLNPEHPVNLRPDICPKCGQFSLIHQEGCATCTDTACGYTKCS